MKKQNIKNAVILATMIVVIGVIALDGGACGFRLVQQVTATLMEIWHSFISKDVVGIV